MKVKAIIEKTDGVYEFTAELSTDQHNFLVEYAIRDLITKGMMPFDMSATENVMIAVGDPEPAVQ